MGRGGGGGWRDRVESLSMKVIRHCGGCVCVCWRCVMGGVLEVCVCVCVLEVCDGGVCWRCVMGGVLEVCDGKVCWRCVMGCALEVCAGGCAGGV